MDATNETRSVLRCGAFVTIRAIGVPLSVWIRRLRGVTVAALFLGHWAVIAVAAFGRGLPS
jgi:hypothetical protein